MAFELLPRYRGLRDSRRLWGQPDDNGKLPRMHLWDYVVLSLLILICFPIALRWVLDSWAYHRSGERQDRSRQEIISNAQSEP